MVAEYLSDAMIRVGAELEQILEKVGLRPDAIFWYYDNSSEKWNLIVVDRRVAAEGSLKFYQKLREALDEASDELRELMFDRIALMGPEQRLAATILNGVKKGQVRSGLRLTGSIIAGSWIEDAYIYRAA